MYTSHKRDVYVTQKECKRIKEVHYTLYKRNVYVTQKEKGKNKGVYTSHKRGHGPVYTMPVNSPFAYTFSHNFMRNVDSVYTLALSSRYSLILYILAL